MTQAQIDNFVNSAGCWLAKENAKLIRAEWRGEDTSCKWRELTLLMHRIDAIQRGALAGETLYNEYQTIVTSSLPSLANNTPPTAVFTDNCTDTTTGKVQALSTVLVDGRTAYDGVMQLLDFRVDADTYYITGGVQNISNTQASLDLLMLSRGLDIDMSGLTITEKTDIGQFRSATNNCGTAKNNTAVRCFLTSNYNYNQSDFTADTTAPLTGANVISIVSFTVDGGSLGTVVYPFAPPLDPTDTNAVIDAFIDLFGVNKVEYAQNGDLANFIATFRFKMTELTKGGPTSYITFNTDLGNIDVPVTVDAPTIGNGVISLEYIINTNNELTGGVINTTNDGEQAQWTCIITQCDALDELVSINIDGVDIPFTTPFTMSSGAAIGAWLSSNAGAGAFTSAWDGTQLTISRTSYTSSTHPRYVSWRRVVAYDYGDPLLLQITNTKQSLPAGYTFVSGSGISNISIWSPGSFYGKEFSLCSGDGGVPGTGNIYIAEYVNGILQGTPSLIYTSPEFPWVGNSESFSLSYHPWADKLIFIVNYFNRGGAPPNYGAEIYTIDSLYAPTMIYQNLGVNPSVLVNINNSNLQNFNQSTGDLLFVLTDVDALIGPTTAYSDILAVDATATLVTSVVSISNPWANQTSFGQISFDSYNSRIWVTQTGTGVNTIQFIAYDSATYTPISSNIIPATTDAYDMSFWSSFTSSYLVFTDNLLNKIYTYDLQALSQGPDNFGITDTIFNSGNLYIVGATSNGYLAISNNFPQRTILIGASETVDFYMTGINGFQPSFEYNPYIGKYNSFLTINYISAFTFSGTAESDQDSPFNVGQSVTYSQAEVPVLATSDNQCLTDAERVALTSDIRKTSSGCCGGGASGSQFSQSPVAIIRGVTANEYIDANGDPLRA